MDGGALRSALVKNVPRLRGDGVQLLDCSVKRLVLTGGRGAWSGTYELRFADGGTGAVVAVRLRGTLWPPHIGVPDTEPSTVAGFGEEGWRGTLPELGLRLETEPPEEALPAFADLTDPDRAGVLLERTLRNAGPRFADLQVRGCVPRVLSYKPGSRCVVECFMDYGPQPRRPEWPDRVVAKTYRRDKGRTAYDGMSALWRSSLRRGGVVTIAEPLAYVPDLHLLIQSAVPGHRSLEEAIAEAFTSDAPGWFGNITGFVGMAAEGLAELHRSDAGFTASVSVEEWFAEIHKLVGQLRVAGPLPELEDGIRPLLEPLEAIARTVPPDGRVPTHGTFDPEQVLLHENGVSLIDFDDYCGAEPAMDVGLFLAAIPDLALTAASTEGRDSAAWPEVLDRARTVADAFLARYEELAPISRPRVALWQAVDFLRDALHTWVKAKPAGPGKDLVILRDFLQHTPL
jgi:hypothetical protein